MWLHSDHNKTFRLHSSLDFCTGHMGLLKCQRVLLISPWLSRWPISIRIETTEPCLLWFCWLCAVGVAISSCCSTLSNPRTGGSSERLLAQPPSLNPPGELPFCENPPVYILGMTFYGVEYSFIVSSGHLSQLSSLTASLANPPHPCKGKKSLT